MKKTFMVGILMIMTALFVILSQGRKENGISDDAGNYVEESTSETAAETGDIYTEYYMDAFHFEEDSSSEADFPKELVEYFLEALEQGRLPEAISMIQADYKCLDEKERKIVIEKENRETNSLANYLDSEGNSDDLWFQADLNVKDDIVIVHTNETGYTNIYYFRNSKGEGIWYDRALRAENYQKGNYPYFVKWDEEVYMLVPYWGSDREQIKGVSIYNFRKESVAGIGINRDNTINICYQIYSRGNEQGGAGWPMIVQQQYEQGL